MTGRGHRRTADSKQVPIGTVTLLFAILTIFLAGCGSEEVSQGELPTAAASGGEETATVEVATVPDVVGRTREEAEEALRSAGFEVKAETQEGPGGETGKVVEQSPSGGGEAEEGVVVVIVVVVQAPSAPEEEAAPSEEVRPSEDEVASGATKIVSDDTGALSVEVPAAWSDVDGAPEELAGVTADASVTASADVAAFREDYEETGVSMSTSTALSEQYTPEEFLDLPDNDFTDGCEDTAREPYDDGNYVGYLDAYTGCGESANEIITIAGVPPSEEYMLVIVMQTSPDEAGKQAQERIILSSAVDEAALP